MKTNFLTELQFVIVPSIEEYLKLLYLKFSNVLKFSKKNY